LLLVAPAPAPTAFDRITALSRIKWLFVIARNSSFTYKGQNVDVK
jgi:adenylate cyclase